MLLIIADVQRKVSPDELLEEIYHECCYVLEGMETEFRLGLGVGLEVGETSIILMREINPQKKDFHGGDARYKIYAGSKAATVLDKRADTITTGVVSCLSAQHEGALLLVVTTAHGEEVFYSIAVRGRTGEYDVQLAEACLMAVRVVFNL